MKATVISTDGTERNVVCTRDEIRRLIGATSLDTVNLRDGRTMYVDDLGHDNDRPVNPKATAMYHAICKPGTTWQICGDVAIVRGNE